MEAPEGGLVMEQTDDRIVLRLFVAGSTPKSTRAVGNLRAILAENLPEGGYELEVVDLYQQPELAKKYGLLAAPTVLKTEPLPVRRIIGDMSDENRVLAALDLIKQGS